MAEVRDLYEILGVPRDATGEDIRKAYRRLAREHHPDVSADPEAEARFKEVTGAYEILKDPDKRRQYDMFGVPGGPGGPGFPFGDVADIFDFFFGGGGTTVGRRGRQRRTRAQRGEDVFARVGLAFREAVFGAHRDLELQAFEACERCGATGAEPGSSPMICRQCRGTGELQEMRRSIFGTVMTARPCAACRGSGEEVLDKCEACFGEGRVARTKTIPVDLPAGVADGLEMRVTGGGHAGLAGGPPGDLYLQIQVEQSALYERRAQDLFSVLTVPMSAAALGADVEIETPDGQERVRLDAGTQPGAVIRLKGRGVPNVNRRGRGDLFITVQVETPIDLNKAQRRLLEQLAESRGEEAGKGRTATGKLRRPPT